MTKNQIIDLLNSDLRNEYMHMHFYLHSAIVIQGLHREELREFLLEEAESEMKHVREFADLIVGLGGMPESLPAPFPTNMTSPKDIISFALNMEDQVVANYTQRMKDAEALSGVDGKWIEIFLEDQILDSRQGADHLRQML